MSPRLPSLLLAALLAACLIAGTGLCAGQDSTSPEKKEAPATLAGSEYSGMYSFLRDGEFVQITVEDQGHVSGFVSRYGELESDRGAFLDHFFKQGKLDGKQLTFTTETVHGVWYEFKGMIETADGKKPGDEGSYTLKGTLTENQTDAQKKVASRSREVALKSFPQDASPAPAKRN
jgi:hypothetical protein